jgi:hypothetical protein
MAAASRQYVDSTGQGGSLQAVFIPELVVRAAARRAGSPDGLDPDAYFEQISTIVVELRRLVAGETVEVPSWVLLTGRDVPRSFSLISPLGKLSVAGAPLMAPSTGSAPELLLTVSYPLSLEFGEPASGLPRASLFASQREFQRRIDHVRLALLLALKSSDPLAVQVASREVSNPLSWSSLSWPWFVPPFSAPVTERDVALVASWCETIAAHHHPSIELAGRRALSAATPGRDSEDRLVDSVIGLENLVGQGAGMRPARAFREAVAAFLTDDPARRRDVSERAGAIYKARSEIVHGRRELDVLEAEQLRLESVELLLGALRRLFTELPSLISDSRRARRLLRPTQDDGGPRATSS